MSHDTRVAARYLQVLVDEFATIKDRPQARRWHYIRINDDDEGWINVLIRVVKCILINNDPFTTYNDQSVESAYDEVNSFVSAKCYGPIIVEALSGLEHAYQILHKSRKNKLDNQLITFQLLKKLCK